MTTSQAPVVQNQLIPEGTQYVWTPAYYKPWVFGIYRRPFYKKENGLFYSYTLHGDWRVTNNDAKWFGEEIELGYFVSIDVFNSKDFVPVEETV